MFSQMSYYYSRYYDAIFRHPISSDKIFVLIRNIVK
jgi:hypothetical protein